MQKRKCWGKGIISVLLPVLSAAVLAGCFGSESGRGTEESEVSAAADVTERDGETKQEETKPKEMAQEETTQEETDQSFRVNIYHGNETAEVMITSEVRLSQVTAEHLTQELIAAGVLEDGVNVNSMKLTENEGLVYMELDFSPEFLEKLNRMGTSGEYFYMGSVVNTFLNAFDAYAVRITAEGKPVESGHNIYEDYLRFFRPNPGTMEGKYKYVNSGEIVDPYVLLQNDGSFVFQYSMLMSSIPAGRYKTESDKITMKREGADMVYVFDIQGENLLFNGDESSETGLPDKAVFEPGY